MGLFVGIPIICILTIWCDASIAAERVERPLTKRHPLARSTRLDTLPGHFVRRLNQISVALFLQETEAWGITPVQYAALQAVVHQPDLDQRKLARTIGFDASTITGVVDRLETRGLIQRSPSPQDRRVRLLRVTKAGMDLLEAVIPAMQQCQARLLEPLNERERETFTRLLRKLVIANNEMSRAPGHDGTG
jgi:MarR family transcriptional regulator, lower aerobic nicotinate degradation pathway regulator